MEKLKVVISNDYFRTVPLTRQTLANLKLKALRRGVWFRALKQSERKLLDLTIRIVHQVRSFLLARLVSEIVGKLCDVMESRVYRLMKSEGRSMVERLSEIAQSWGYWNAKYWAHDLGFMQYLVINNLSEFSR